MSDVEIAIAASKKYEATLEQRFGAVGKGLHEKAGSVEHLLDAQTLKCLRTVATLRNRLVHEPNVTTIDDPERFHAACAHLDIALGTVASPQVRLPVGADQLARYQNYRAFAVLDVPGLLRSKKYLT